MDANDAVNMLQSVSVETLALMDSHIRPATKQELKDWAYTYFGWTFASVQVCENHQPPLDILWELFNEDVLDVVILASRTGGKTALLATLNVLDAIFKPRCEIASMGAVLYQAEKGYSYFAEMMRNELFVADVESTIMKETRLRNGSTIHIITGTMTGANCLGGDTVVDTLDGKPMLKELEGLSGFWVHGYDVGNRRWTIGQVQRVWRVGTGPTVRVTHEGGVVFASPDHPFLLLNGEWRRAGSLRVGDRLMPLDRKLRSTSDGGWYWWVNGNGGRQVQEHKFVLEEVLGRPVKGRDLHVHHIDNDGLNNQPWNLLLCTNSEHQGIHDTERKRWKRMSDEEKAVERKKRSERVKAEWARPERREIQQATWRNQTMSASDSRPWTDAETMRELYEDKLLSMPEIAAELGCCLRTVAMWLDQHGIKSRDISYARKVKHAKNHRVISVEMGPVMDLYDMTVEGCHNFVACGTVVSNSPHPHKFRADEVELIDWSILQQAFSMARSERGIMGSNVLSSTRKGLFGSMQRLLDKISAEPGFPFQLRSWCVLEIMQRCDRNCATCRDIVRAGDEQSFWDFCKGRAKSSDGFYPIFDAHRKFLTLDPEVWDAEWGCHKPAKEGVIYKAMPEDRFGRYPFDPMLETFAGVDDGFVDPFAFLLMQTDPGNNVYVVRELYGPGLEPSTWAEHVGELFEELGLQKSDVTLFVDIRAKGLAAELRKAGFKVRGRSWGVVDSIRQVKKWVRGVSHPKLFIDSEHCPNLKREMGLYRYKPGTEVPEDKDNHCPDAMRYGLCGRFPIFHDTGDSDVPVSAGDGGKMAKRMAEREDAYSPRRQRG